MSRTEIESALRAIAEREFGEIDVEARLGALDSLERMQLAVAVEDHFQILIHASDEPDLGSVADIARLVERKLGEK